MVQRPPTRAGPSTEPRNGNGRLTRSMNALPMCLIPRIPALRLITTSIRKSPHLPLADPNQRVLATRPIRESTRKTTTAATTRISTSPSTINCILPRGITSAAPRAQCPLMSTPVIIVRPTRHRLVRGITNLQNQSKHRLPGVRAPGPNAQVAKPCGHRPPAMDRTSIWIHHLEPSPVCPLRPLLQQRPKPLAHRSNLLGRPLRLGIVDLAPSGMHSFS